MITIKNPRALRHDYIPNKLPFREQQYGRLKNELEMINFGLATHLLILGHAGTGKTVTVRKALVESNVPSIYVVAEQNTYATLVKIAEILYEKKKRFWGFSFGLIWDELDKLLPQPVVIVIDEAEKFMVKDERGDELLYYLSRRPDTYVFLISNKINLMEYVREPRVKSSFRPRVISFPSYSADELYTIVRYRLEETIGEEYEKHFEDAALQKIAALGAKIGGDARYVIDLLRESIRIAISKGSDRVTVDHVDQAKISLEYQYVLDSVYTLPPSSLLLLYIACRSEDKRTTTLYRLYNKYSGYYGLSELSERRLRSMLIDLEQGGFVSIVKAGRHYLVKPSKWISEKAIRLIKKRLLGSEEAEDIIWDRKKH